MSSSHGIPQLKRKGLWLVLLLLAAFRISCQQKAYEQTLWTVAWSPDGKYIATGGNQDELKIFSGSTFELLKTYPVEKVQLSRIKWHPTKNIVAIITQSSTVKARILDIDTGFWTDLEGLTSSFRALDWNFNGTLLAVSELEKAVSVYTLNGKRISRFLTDPKSSAALDWHPTENILVTAGSQIGLFTHLGDTLTTFKPRQKETFLLCVEWHPSGAFFAVGDYGDLEKAENKMIQFWNAEGDKLAEISQGAIEYRNIRWNAEGDKLASASEALKIWSPTAALLAESKPTDDYLWGVDWSPDGRYIVTSSKKGRIVIWNEKAEFVKELKY